METQRSKSLSTYSSRWPATETGPWHLLRVCFCGQLCCEGHLAPDHLEGWVGESVGFEPAVYIWLKLANERLNWALEGSAATSDFLWSCREQPASWSLKNMKTCDRKGSLITVVLENVNLVGDVSVLFPFTSFFFSLWLIIVVSHQFHCFQMHTGDSFWLVLLCWFLPIKAICLLGCNRALILSALRGSCLKIKHKIGNSHNDPWIQVNFGRVEEVRQWGRLSLPVKMYQSYL